MWKAKCAGWRLALYFRMLSTDQWVAFSVLYSRFVRVWHCVIMTQRKEYEFWRKLQQSVAKGFKVPPYPPWAVCHCSCWHVGEQDKPVRLTLCCKVTKCLFFWAPFRRGLCCTASFIEQLKWFHSHIVDFGYFLLALYLPQWFTSTTWMLQNIGLLKDLMLWRHVCFTIKAIMSNAHPSLSQ